MADQTQEVYLAPAGGLNQSDGNANASDDAAGASLFSHGDYRYALNLHIGRSKSINEGSAENFQSTLLCESYFVWNGSAWVSGTAPADTNNARGKYEDHNDGKIYWAVQNSNGNDAILMFNKAERRIYELIQWTGFHFSNFVSMTKIDKFLILTDGNPDDASGSPPRIIDVTTIYTLKATLAGNFSEYHISFVKWAPVLPPLVTVNGLGNGNVFIAKGIYQFAYRYIYVGGSKSCWSPPSQFVTNEQSVVVNGGNPSPLTGIVSNISVRIDGFIFDYSTPANTAFNHGAPQFYYFVEFIELAYRDSAFANWKLYSRLPIVPASPPSIPLISTFANSGPIVNVADNEIGQYFDAVPLLSRAVEAIDNRPMFGNNLDDLPPMADLSVTNVEVYSVQPTDDNWFATFGLIPSFSFKENGIYKLGIIFKDYSGRSGLVQTLDNWTYNIPVNSTNANPIAQEDWHALGFKIGNGLIPPIWAVDYQIVRSNCLNVEMFIVGVINDFKFLTIDLNSTASDNSLSTSDAIKSAITGYYNNYNTGGSQYSLISRIISAIRHNFETTLPNCTLIYINITNWVLDTNHFEGTPINPSNAVYYNWVPGDRVRFWSNSVADYSGSWTEHDQEIIDYTGTGILISRPVSLGYTQNRRTVPTGPNKLYTIEVYRPIKFSKENDVIFYEMGEWYPVVQPRTANRAFSKTDFTWGGTGQVTTTTVAGYSIHNKYPIVNGDVWLVRKNFFYNVGSIEGGPLIIGSGYLGPFISGGPVPNFNFSVINDYPVFPQMTQDKFNAAGIWEHNNGRPLVAYRYLPKQFNKATQIRFGGKFLEDSLFIGINNFQEGSQFIYPGEYGAIRALCNVSNVVVKAMGNILLVMGEEETWSVYVNRTTLEDLSGRGQVSLSDKVLGSFNTLLGSYGTLNPESVSRRNSRVIFWSEKQGKWIRYSDDGLTPISDRKMYNWFNDLSILLAPSYQTATPARALTVFDNYFEEWVTHLDHPDLPSTFRGYASYKGCSFSEDDKRWKTFYDFSAEFFAALENETYSIIGSTISIHYAGADYGSFYGVKKDCYWQPVANAEFRRKKIWKAVGLEATDKWSFTLEGDFKSNGALTQVTNIGLTDLTELEDMFWSDIKRDINTPNKTGNDARTNGNVMRSKALTILGKMDPAVTWYSYVNWVMASYDISQKTLKK